MPPGSPLDPLLTLEPLLEAVREGLERAGWGLSGLQKTTSYEFEGRWAGESSRSAYLFFHRDGIPEWVSIDVFLDETSRGLKGNLALVLEGPALVRVGDPGKVLSGLARVGAALLPEQYRVPLTLKYGLPSLDADPEGAETEYRFKLHIPRNVLAAGRGSVADLASRTARGFEEILASREMIPFLEEADSDPA
jgi:hypothetical protein